VFVVDDDASVRGALARLLHSAGYQTEAFSSAEGFLAQGRFDAPGCILLDVRMPGLNVSNCRKRSPPRTGSCRLSLSPDTATFR